MEKGALAAILEGIPYGAERRSGNRPPLNVLLASVPGQNGLTDEALPARVAINGRRFTFSNLGFVVSIS